MLTSRCLVAAIRLFLQDNLDAGTVGKIVDCVISLKSYHEWKQAGGANGPNKYMKSPLAVRYSQIQSENVASGPSPSLKRLDLTEVDADTQTFQNLDPNMKGLCHISPGLLDTLYTFFFFLLI